MIQEIIYGTEKKISNKIAVSARIARMKLFALLLCYLAPTDGFKYHRHPITSCSKMSAPSLLRLRAQIATNQIFDDNSPSSSIFSSIVAANVLLVLFAPQFARAAEVSVFEDPALLKQALGGLVVGLAWIVPYFVFNVIIAPRIGLLVEDEMTEEKNKNRDFF